MRRLALSISLIAILLCATAYAQQFAIQNLGNINPSAINDSGQIVGIATTTEIAEIWNNGVVTPIAPPGASQSFAYEINDAGEVVGTGTSAQYVDAGFAWNSASGFITPPISEDQSDFRAVNNLGDIGGVSWNNGDSGGTASVWDAQGNMTTLPPLPGADDSAVRAINDVGQVVGTSGYSGSDNYPSNINAPLADNHAVLWENGTIIDLTPNAPWSDTYAINNEGQVVGYWFDHVNDDFISIPFVWDSTHGLVDLPHTGFNSIATDINNLGQIVGTIGTGDDASPSVAMLWENGTEYDLNDYIPANSGWDLQFAFLINDMGQIVGFGTYDGQPASFLLTPIPEPATISVTVLFFLLPRSLRRKEKFSWPRSDSKPK